MTIIMHLFDLFYWTYARIILVPGGGLEPPWDCSLRILSPLRLPISPSGHASILWGRFGLEGTCALL